jgi:predicted dehydrogenase
MSNRIRWGVVGAGGIARRRTIPEGIVASDEAELCATYDIDPAVNSEVARQFHAAAAASLDDLLASDIDAVYIASPADCHRSQVTAAAAAGKHVLCEKPLGMTVAEAEAMIAACRGAGVRLGVGLMMRFHAYHRAALEMVQSGRLGRLVLGRAQLSCWYPPIAGAWRQDPARGGGGSLIDMGSHAIDLLEMFFGPVEEVFCRTGNLVQSYASEDGAAVLLKFQSGALGTIDAFFCIPDTASKNRLEIYGGRGSILAESTIGQAPDGRMTAYLDDDRGSYDALQMRDAAGGLCIAPPPVNTYRAEIDEFCRAIRQRREPLNGGELGLWNTRVLAACYESARHGTSVRLVPSDQRSPGNCRSRRA